MAVFSHRVFLAAALAAGTALAQESAMRLPISGLLVDDQARSIRPIMGMPGSAYAGQASVSEFDFASAAPDGRNAIITKDAKSYIVRRLDGGIPVWRELADGPANLSLTAWNENSDTAALVNGERTELELWSKLSTDPKLVGKVDLAGVTERLVSLSVDKEGRFAFAATQGESTGTLYLLSPGEEPRMLIPLERAGVLLLAGDALYVTDRGHNEVLKVTNWKQTPSVAVAAAAGLGLVDPVGIGLSQDQKLLYVANAGTRQILAVDLSSSALKGALDLDFEPTRLDRLGLNSLFLLEKGVPGVQPAQVLDTNAQKVFFVPVSAAATGE
jgi:hypothetical protein